MSRAPMVRIIADALLEAETAEDKVIVLKKYHSDSLFKRIVQYAHNPLIDFGMNNFTPKSSTIGKEDGMGISKFMHLPEDVYQNNLNRDEAEFAINMVLSHINELEVDLFLGIFAKDLGLGLTLDIINEAWPDHIPPYPVMTHVEFDETTCAGWLGYVVQPDYPGERVNIIMRNSKVEFRNEEGKLLEGFDKYIPQFLQLSQNGRIVIDALWNGKKFMLFDSIRYDGFVEGKDNRLGYNWRYNGIEHMVMLAKVEDPCFVLPQHIPIQTLEAAKEEVAKFGKPCYLKNPAGIWFNGPNVDVQLLTPDSSS